MATSIDEIKNLKLKMVSRKVDNEMVLVPLVNDVAEMKVIYTLNEVAAFIWEKIDKANSIEEIALSITQNFDIDEKTALNDTQNFITEILTK